MKAARPVRGGAVGKGLSLDTTWDKTGKSEKTQHLAGRLLYYDLEEPLPDHSSLTRIRERYGLEVFRRFFDKIVEQCQAAGLVWGKELYFDGTKVAANAGKESVKPRFAVEAHLSNLFDTGAEEPLEEEQQQTAEEPTPHEHEELPAPRALPTSLPSEEYEALAQHNAARHDWIEKGSPRSPRERSQLSAHSRLSGQHHRSGCDDHA